MEDGQDGTLGAHAQCNVEAELRYDYAHVPIPRLPLVEHNALEKDDKSNRVTRVRVEVMFLIFSFTQYSLWPGARHPERPSSIF